MRNILELLGFKKPQQEMLRPGKGVSSHQVEEARITLFPDGGTQIDDVDEEGKPLNPVRGERGDRNTNQRKQDSSR